LRRSGHLLGSWSAIHIAARISAGTEAARPIARIRISRIRLSETVEAGPRRVLLRLATIRVSAAVEAVHAMLGLN
jgi:hypothetical protein